MTHKLNPSAVGCCQNYGCGIMARQYSRKPCCARLLYSMKLVKFNSNMHRIRALFAMLAFLLLTACASAPPKVLSEKEYYDKAKSALDSGNFLEAARHLEDLETYHPFGRYAEQAQLDLIYAHYNSLNPERAESAAERFIRLHPESPHVDYAYYIKGLAAYYADLGLGPRFLPIDVNSRDPGRAKEAFRDFSTLVTNFPDSPYAADAEKRMLAIKERLAQYEMHVARYYIRRQAYVAAVARTQYVVENYPETPVVPEALSLMVELYRYLGMQRHADDALVLLATSYPDYKSFDANMRFNGSEFKEEDRNISSVFDFDFGLGD
ncbi:outer membrane protein assembly factor BamD [Hahella sp. CR1]|uniref:outer membrane protein assembly factor BamD n=2 Tax=unclassified Hahella TaxID=2624107 RepID=UPI002441EC98|nr:outer membrane protein assembly factor BamD [Hahella sp. CR1]MDG9670398.1 outer membrane protein assembly factor BamD [Hahella sp. CR1]